MISLGRCSDCVDPDRFKIKKLLPLPSHLQYMWLDIRKIIDTLHIVKPQG